MKAKNLFQTIEQLRGCVDKGKYEMVIKETQILLNSKKRSKK